MHCTAQYTIQMEIVAFRTFSEIIKYGKDTTTVDMIKSEIFVLHFYRLNANQPLKLIGWFERKVSVNLSFRAQFAHNLKHFGKARLQFQVRFLSDDDEIQVDNSKIPSW